MPRLVIKLVAEREINETIFTSHRKHECNIIQQNTARSSTAPNFSPNPLSLILREQMAKGNLLCFPYEECSKLMLIFFANWKTKEISREQNSRTIEK